MASAQVPNYYIRDGVRRAVAAFRAGLIDIPAVIAEQGKPDVRTRIAISQLYSPKSQVARDSRYIVNTEYPTQVLKTEPPPIQVEFLGLRGQLRALPVSQVQLT